jgi:hypothetical protein
VVTSRVDCIVMPAVCVAGQMVEFGDVITWILRVDCRWRQGARMPRRHTAYRGGFMTAVLKLGEASVP